MRLYLGDDFFGFLIIRIPVFARGRRTGVPVDGLVSYPRVAAEACPRVGPEPRRVSLVCAGPG